MAAPKFEILTGLQYCIRRDFPLADDTLLNPYNANPLVQGEWLELNGSEQLARGSSEGATSKVFPVHTEKGRTDVQGIGKADVIFLGQFEAETTVVHLSGLAVGDYLTVQDVTHESLTRRGLKKKAGTSGGIVVVGQVSAINGTKVRFIHFGKQVVF